MDFDQTLTNPTVSDIESEGDEEQPAPVAPPRDQLSLDVDSPSTPITSWVGNVRQRASRRELELELMPFWKSLAAPFALVSSLSLVLVVFFTGITFFEKIPPQIPFYYNSVDSRWEQADKIIILFLPVALGVLDAVLLRVIYAIFSFDKRLSVILSWMLTLLNLLILIAFTQIYLLVL